MRGTKEARFWAKVDTTAGLLGCWPWQGSIQSNGYGSFDSAGAHRYALELQLGRPLGPEMHACHTCDNKPCVNPTHLFEGTHQDNMADRHAKGRDATGDRNGARLHPERLARGDRHAARRIPLMHAGIRNGRHRLTEDDVRVVRRRLAERIRWIDIAAEFGVSKPTISHIAAGRTWTHVV